MLGHGDLVADHGVADKSLHYICRCFLTVMQAMNLMTLFSRVSSHKMGWAKALNVLLCFSIGSFAFTLEQRFLLQPSAHCFGTNKYEVEPLNLFLFC